MQSLELSCGFAFQPPGRGKPFADQEAKDEHAQQTSLSASFS